MEIRNEKRNTPRYPGSAGETGKRRAAGRRVRFAPPEKGPALSAEENAEEAEEKKEPSFRSGIEIGKYGIMMSLFVFSGMILFMLSGYEKISRSYQEVNTINAQIEETKLNINALEVAIECAVTIEEAQQWAKAHNMQYPLQSQYVVSGSSIPVTRGGTSGTGAAPAGN